MRAELAAIHVALTVHKHDPWLGIFTDSKTSLHAIQNELQKPSHTTYHHHKPLIAAIVDSLLYIAELGFTTILHKIRGHTDIRGNDLADVTGKKVVSNWDDIPEHQKLTVTIGWQVERPTYWIMYTHPSPPIQLAIGPLPATLRQP
jgi:ribonuclease HI